MCEENVELMLQRRRKLKGRRFFFFVLFSNILMVDNENLKSHNRKWRDIDCAQAAEMWKCENVKTYYSYMHIIIINRCINKYIMTEDI